MTKDFLTEDEHEDLKDAFFKRPGSPGPPPVGNLPGDLEFPWFDIFNGTMDPSANLDSDNWTKEWLAYNATIKKNGIIGEINWVDFRRNSGTENPGSDDPNKANISFYGGSEKQGSIKFAKDDKWGRERFSRDWYYAALKWLSNKKYVGKGHYGYFIGEQKIPGEGEQKGTVCFPSGQEAAAAMSDSYLQTLNKTIYSPDLAQNVLYPIARKVVAYLKNRGSDDLTRWFEEREELIEASEGNVAPWDPNYDFKDFNWVNTRLLQEFLYSLQLTHFGIEIITAYVNSPNVKPFVNQAFVGANATPITWATPL
ncbi:MAG: hypothetical protein GY915_06025, partial [bacterium]|nr:hypothetical protein [bacterium]